MQDIDPIDGDKKPSGLIGTRLKNYEIEALLGKGGMGAVYRARDVKLDRQVALKVLPPELMRDPERRKRFVQEAKAASAVNHPAITQIYEIADEGDMPFIAMEYVDGSTVGQLVDRGELDILSGVEIGMQVAEALARAHEAGIIHRDIKSDNIMVTRDGHPKVLDFGLAKLVDVSAGEEGDVSNLQTLTMTQAGLVMGTVAYMSPEQARGMPVDSRSDIFSFGIVLYEMATGELPFRGKSALDTMHSIAFENTRPIRTIRSNLPMSLQRVVDRCLAKEPEKRYQNLDVVVSDLRKVRKEVESGATSAVPLLEHARMLVDQLPSVAKGLSGRGMFVLVFWGALALLIGGGMFSDRNPAGIFPILFIGFLVYRHFRARRTKQMKRFAKKASKLKEVQLITYEGDTIIVGVRGPKARTFVKLNGLLESANEGLYQGVPFRMQIREDIEDDELRELAMQSSVQYLRET
jgi:serine/threonine protein kinase